MAVGWLYVLLRVKDKRKVALIMAVSQEVSLLNCLNERYRSQIIRPLADKNASALDYNNIPMKQKDANTLDVHLQTSIFLSLHTAWFCFEKGISTPILISLDISVASTSSGWPICTNSLARFKSLSILRIYTTKLYAGPEQHGRIRNALLLKIPLQRKLN